MKINIVRIGNSKGIRLPKSVLEQCRLKDSVEIEVEDNVLIIRPVHAPRSGWSEAFSGMAQRKDDKLLDEDTTLATEWDRSEWRW
ncbi:MAG: AbrB/MazE/SpoVT family DNA-binding domain-containing protein [Gammaproteobacteria bacterium]|nr:AbrB/MazE/SpoVT family DNA-binding domain-containing protein [Gammaproteobacteria bacterium]